LELTWQPGVERAVEWSGHPEARATAMHVARRWGRIVFLGEDGTIEFQPSADLAHNQKTIYDSWVTSIWRMEELVECLVRWQLFPSSLATHRVPLFRIGETYALMVPGRCGKVAVCFDEEKI
jgi:threonine dehydrogenase-like Zn-dependent dehydrogenase